MIIEFGCKSKVNSYGVFYYILCIHDTIVFKVDIVGNNLSSYIAYYISAYLSATFII